MSKVLGRFSTVAVIRTVAFSVAAVLIVMSLLTRSDERSTVFSVTGPPPDSCVADTQSSACYEKGDRIWVEITTAGSNAVLRVPAKLGGPSKSIDLGAGTFSVTSNLAHLGSIEPSSFTVPEGGQARVAFVWPAAS